MIELFCILVFSLFWTSQAIPINNGVVGRPEVICGTDSITMSFHTERQYRGKIYAKGHAYTQGCVAEGNSKTYQSFTLNFNQCGMRRVRQLNGITVTQTLIVSFHKFFITKVDRAYRITCFYMEALKTVTQQIDVSMLTTLDIRERFQMPVCRYDILFGGPDGQPVKFARIGEKVYHKWTCEGERNMYCMRVHTCYVDDGQGGVPFQVLDNKGCAVDIFVLQDLEYVTDLMAGQEAHVFKFADRPTLYFNCQVEIRLRDSNFGCTNVIPNCDSGSNQYPTPLTFQPEYNGRQSQLFPTTFRPEYRGRGRQSPLQRQQRDINHDPSIIADFDVPTQSFTVLDIEASDSSRERNGTIDHLPILPFVPEERRKRICLSPERFAGLTVSLVALCLLSIVLIVVGILRRNALLAIFPLKDTY